MKRAVMSLIFALALVLPSLATADDAKYVLELGTIATADTPWGKQLKQWKKTIEAESGGLVDVKIHWGGKMGDEVSMMRQLKRNELQAFAGSTGAVATDVPELAIFELCYLFDGLEHADRVIDTALTEPIREILAGKGYVLYTFGENGFRNFATKGKAIHGPDDLAGLKMRAQEAWNHEEAYRAWGGNPVMMPISEVGSSLATGNIDGFDNTPLFAFAAQWYKDIDTWTVSDHIYQPALIVYNKEWFDALKAETGVDLQAAVMKDADKQLALGRKLVRKMQPKLIENLKDAGVTVYEMTKDEKKAMAGRCTDVHKKYVEKVGGRAKELLDAAKAVK